jgi:hypothetical protein
MPPISTLATELPAAFGSSSNTVDAKENVKEDFRDSPKCFTIQLDALLDGSDNVLHPDSYDNDLLPSSLRSSES